jgi:hypothetical protein
MITRGIRILIAIFVIYGILVSTHLGEFWPFSIYPMFSQAGKPWTRALVVNVTNSPPSDWKTETNKDFSGDVFAMDNVGINQNDLANFISKNKYWTKEKVQGVRTYFEQRLDNQELLIYKVQGKLADADTDSTVVNYIPYVYLKRDTTILNPQLIHNKQEL